MSTPENLLDLAKQQIALNHETAYRSACHLAYYALFHAAYEFVNHDTNAQISDTHALHSAIRRYLKDRKSDKLLVNLGRALANAFDIRVQADYFLQEPINHDTAELQYENCHNYLTQLRQRQAKNQA